MAARPLTVFRQRSFRRLVDPRTVIVLLELERRVAEPLTVAQLAGSVNLSASRLAHLFRKDVGTGPMRHLQILRMECAATLLARTSLMVSDVMMHVGYTDPSHFRRDFRRHHGLPPREWRRAHQFTARR
jgi:transcriptional regulator GlxA family with amidase domain